MDEKKDYSNECTHDDDTDKRCWKCRHFLFPVGCMQGEDEEEKIEEDE